MTKIFKDTEARLTWFLLLLLISIERLIVTMKTRVTRSMEVRMSRGVMDFCDRHFPLVLNGYDQVAISYGTLQTY